MELEQQRKALGDFIRSQRKLANLSLRQMAALADISNPYLSQIERGLRRPSAEILQQIAKALRISAETLYVQAGILEPGTGEADLAREILADPYLTDDQKQALIRIYLSFRHETGPAGAGLSDSPDSPDSPDRTENPGMADDPAHPENPGNSPASERSPERTGAGAGHDEKAAAAG
jgi:transcriptional regulator with XRE-family HTH domain